MMSHECDEISKSDLEDCRCGKRDENCRRHVTEVRTSQHQAVRSKGTDRLDDTLEIEQTAFERSARLRPQGDRAGEGHTNDEKKLSWCCRAHKDNDDRKGQRQRNTPMRTELKLLGDD
jgi:hypothetical protein